MPKLHIKKNTKTQKQKQKNRYFQSWDQYSFGSEGGGFLKIMQAFLFTWKKGCSLLETPFCYVKYVKFLYVHNKHLKKITLLKVI